MFNNHKFILCLQAKPAATWTNIRQNINDYTVGIVGRG